MNNNMEMSLFRVGRKIIWRIIPDICLFTISSGNILYVAEI
jgi:hypothetical protein